MILKKSKKQFVKTRNLNSFCSYHSALKLNCNSTGCLALAHLFAVHRGLFKIKAREIVLQNENQRERAKNPNANNMTEINAKWKMK